MDCTIFCYGKKLNLKYATLFYVTLNITPHEESCNKKVNGLGLNSSAKQVFFDFVASSLRNQFLRSSGYSKVKVTRVCNSLN